MNSIAVFLHTFELSIFVSKFLFEQIRKHIIGLVKCLTHYRLLVSNFAMSSIHGFALLRLHLFNCCHTFSINMCVVIARYWDAGIQHVIVIVWHLFIYIPIMHILFSLRDVSCKYFVYWNNYLFLNICAWFFLLYICYNTISF